MSDRDESVISGRMPDEFDRMTGSLDGLPNTVRTGQATIHTTTPLLGLSETWIVQTIRQRDLDDPNARLRDTVLIQKISAAGGSRLVLPPRVTEVIARQRDALTGKNRVKGARARAELDKKNGVVPGFLRGKKAAAAK